MILLAPRCITIMRRLQGMKMHLLVPAESYAGVVLAREDHPSGTVFSIRLAHRDPELSMNLRTASNRRASIDAWRQWAAYFAVPALIERASGQWEIIEPLPLSGVGSFLALPHHCTGASSKRRRRLPLCRKRGRTGRQRTFRGSASSVRNAPAKSGTRKTTQPYPGQQLRRGAPKPHLTHVARG